MERESRPNDSTSVTMRGTLPSPSLLFIIPGYATAIGGRYGRSECKEGVDWHLKIIT